jgi:pre-mRNA-splicing factor ATP-dependent RNA helicase DHX15/PRP43
MADRRSDSADGNRAKRQKIDSSADANMGKKPYNPYLAHMYEDEDGNNMKNGYGGAPLPMMNGRAYNSPLTKFQRHQSTSAQAKKAEDGPMNPFNGKPLSSRYFSILKTRRDLPVHAQRYVFPALL